jgi:hypothetical protein
LSGNSLRSQPDLRFVLNSGIPDMFLKIQSFCHNCDDISRNVLETTFEKDEHGDFILSVKILKSEALESIG